MPRRATMPKILEGAVFDVIAEEVRETDRQARKAARLQAVDAEAARMAADPTVALRERVAEIGEQLDRLRPIRGRGGDALAGMLTVTLERERAEILRASPKT